MDVDYNARIIEEFRANGGKLGGPFEGAPILLLTTTGARTGKARTSPVLYGRDGGRLLIFASNGGRPAHPAWYHNLLANPKVTVEVGGDLFTALAVPLAGEERDRLFSRQAEIMPNFGVYQAATSRTIPVVALDRQGD
ncbi:nitroreductase family deazaflavin-dependent oxidoreductase [Sphaerisporangium album]|uniref:Nitroreductase family deazaflavin-dependent oxidoreductase n=1 Tax=Sphaerisporangium album TaxID=509200 RepID=A0A367FPZ8_9ACTN|nr:nitroreductase family deazaflavin-dependent oxidoreductase [Sphaerisporangium album]RCG31685.1 nitroreductase family deazaflavin-dependent oxidoreductase [Sphaerisporangium album]